MLDLSLLTLPEAFFAGLSLFGEAKTGAAATAAAATCHWTEPELLLELDERRQQRPSDDGKASSSSSGDRDGGGVLVSGLGLFGAKWESNEAGLEERTDDGDEELVPVRRILAFTLLLCYGCCALHRWARCGLRRRGLAWW